MTKPGVMLCKLAKERLVGYECEEMVRILELRVNRLGERLSLLINEVKPVNSNRRSKGADHRK